MIKYISTKGQSPAVDFESAILAGFAPDGGLYVPDRIPEIASTQLEEWRHLSYLDLAFEILSLYIDRSVMPATDLRELLQTAYAAFEAEEIITFHPLASSANTQVVELFHGPTLSFKDIGMAFLVHLFHYFLARRKEYRTLLVATTGDTGPAAAYFSAGKSTLDAWVLYPDDKITEMQERQMTTLPHANVHPVAVTHCPEGGDDLDAVIARIFADKSFKAQLNISSVNSINWGRIMMQSVHYFYAYFQTTTRIGEPVSMAVPSGGFGNLCGGSLARKMGLPIRKLIAANNKNACLHRIFSERKMQKEELYETLSSAIDILVPINFWRHLYFVLDDTPIDEIGNWQDTFEKTGEVIFSEEIFAAYANGFLSHCTTDSEVAGLIKAVFEEEAYLLDPHAAVALAAIDALQDKLEGEPLLCFATAHPAKFPEVVQAALGKSELPVSGGHPSIEAAKQYCEKVYRCDNSYLESALRTIMERRWEMERE